MKKPGDAMLIAIVYDTGFRASELIALDVQDLTAAEFGTGAIMRALGFKTAQKLPVMQSDCMWPAGRRGDWWRCRMKERIDRASGFRSAIGPA